MKKKKPKKDRSNCCSAPVQVSTADEGTSCWMCDDCGNPCDLEVPCKLENPEAESQNLMRETLDLNGNPIDKETRKKIDEAWEEGDIKERAWIEQGRKNGWLKEELKCGKRYTEIPNLEIPCSECGKTLIRIFGQFEVSNATFSLKCNCQK